MKIIHFNPYVRSYNITSSSIVTVHNEDKKTLKKYCKNYRITPYKIYVLFNYTKGYESLVAYYLKHKLYKYYEFENTLEVLTLWEILFKDFNKKYFCRIPKLINQIKNVEIILNLKPLKRDLNLIVYDLLIPLYEKGILLEKNFNKKTNKPFNDYYSIYDKLINLKGQNREIDYYLTSFIDSFPSHISNLEKKFFFISAYFYKLSLFHYKNKNYTISLQLLHRMVDVYLLFLCQQVNIKHGKNFIDTIGKLRVKDLSFTKDHINLIDILNKTRNKLYLTHGLYSISKVELEQNLIKVKKMVLVIDGYEWSNLLKRIEFNYKLLPLDLFKYEPSFETYFKDITEEFNENMTI